MNGENLMKSIKKQGQAMPKITDEAETCLPVNWRLFEPVTSGVPEPDFADLTAIPPMLDAGGDRLPGKDVRLARCPRFLEADLGILTGGAEEGKTAYLLGCIETEADVSLDVGAGADWWMKIWCNGRVVCDTLSTGNGAHERINHRFALPLRRGRNLLAVKVLSGKQGFRFMIGGSRELAEEDVIERRIAEDQSLLLIPPRIRPFIDPEFGPENTNFVMMSGGIARTRGGRLWVLWAGGEDGPNAWLLMAGSDDDGRSWQTRHIIKEPRTPNGFLRPVRDGNLWIDPSGRLWCFFTYSLGYCDGRLGVWAARCDEPDAGTLAWSIPERLYDGLVLSKPLILQDGAWLLSTSLWDRALIGIALGDRRESRAFTELDPWRMANFLASTDHGKTWQRRGGVFAANRDYDEPALFEKADGAIVCLLRTHEGRSETVSYDHGFNWSKPVPSRIPHPNARILTLRLASGRILMVKHGPLTGERIGRTHLTAYLSDDDGVSWRGGLLLEERDCSYPDGVQAEDGRIYVVYDQGRAGGQILMAVFTEEDVAAGQPVSDCCRLKAPVKQTAAQLKRSLRA
jgi:hypothetical protein